ncbi:ABC transporter substrate-binding protein [Microcoleus sp. FACHB-672]|uniref:ABC transporter substrate-binding protein n=1 Tax=Microcoleus sp. FACHB-672 TaxID=2692825 RepID=UPI0016879075|nr:ABC transporter substrate-binding protein [Microcoleus sp. FACHB-672]MBD2042742.1 ABC transporter substrate-binding protein [Microcoleus sp. FACHB-672]
MRAKRLAGFVISILALITLAGCRTKDTIPAQQVVTLAGWQSNLSEQRLLKQLIQKFEEKYPHIKVKYEVINSEYMSVIYTRLAGGTAPDVFYLEAFEAPRLMKEGALESLNAYVTTDFNIADFEKRLLDAFRNDGEIYGIPKDFSTLALFYNKQAFKEAGISQPPRNWEELIRYSQKLTADKNKDGKIDRYGFGVSPELARQYFMIKACGGELTDQAGKAAFATPVGLKGLQFVIDQYRKDQSSAQPSDVGASWGAEMLGAGKAAMVIEGLWAIPNLKDTFPRLNYAVVEVPAVCGKKGTMAFTVAYAMNKDAKNKPAAWELIAFLTGTEAMKISTSTGFALPSRQSVMQTFKQNPQYIPFTTGAGYATVWQGGERLSKIVTSFNNQFISAMIGQQSLSEAMQKSQETANKDCMTP